MVLSYKARRRWSLVLLLVGLPLYIIAASLVMTWLFPDPLNRPHILAELGIYAGLGVVWALPFRFVFKGVGQADPDAPPRDD